MEIKKKTLVVFLAVIYVFCLSSCNSKSQGGNKNFSYYLDSSVTSLDPQTIKGTDGNSIITAIFEGLCRLDYEGNAIPGVAKMWVSNSDKTEYTFILRDDAKWSNGEAVTADDFLFGITRALDPNSKATDVEDLLCITGAKDIYGGLADISKLGVKVISDTVLVIYLEEERDNFPEMTAGNRFMPCNRDFFSESAGRYGLEPSYLITNGAFDFYSIYAWEPNVSIRLGSSSYYYNSDSVIPSEIYFYMSTPESITSDKVTALSSGSADILKLSQEEYELAVAAGIECYDFNNGVTGLLFNNTAEYLENETLRNIFTSTIDRASVFDGLNTTDDEATDIVPRGMEWDGESYRSQAESDLYVKEDFSSVNNLSSVLSTMGLEAVPAITITCLNDELSMEIANRIIVSWNTKIGSYFNILPLDPSSYWTAVYNKDYQVVLYTVSADSNSPAAILKNFDSTSSPQLFSSQAYDSLFYSAYKNIEDYVGLEKLLNNQSIFYPLLNDYSYYGISPKVTGLNVTIGYTDFRSARK